MVIHLPRKAYKEHTPITPEIRIDKATINQGVTYFYDLNPIRVNFVPQYCLKKTVLVSKHVSLWVLLNQINPFRGQNYMYRMANSIDISCNGQITLEQIGIGDDSTIQLYKSNNALIDNFDHAIAQAVMNRFEEIKEATPSTERDEESFTEAVEHMVSDDLMEQYYRCFEMAKKNSKECPIELCYKGMRSVFKELDKLHSALSKDTRSKKEVDQQTLNNM